ncbi:MAG TPA: hypothetical protein DCP71_03690 [Verrucomicrobiales bacterium]|nr:hypothetical protein [Verrucomicrobiales bacterium]
MGSTCAELQAGKSKTASEEKKNFVKNTERGNFAARLFRVNGWIGLLFGSLREAACGETNSNAFKAGK